MAELAYKDEARYEKINGQWIMMSPARAEHVITVGNIYSEFRQYLKGKRCIPFTDGVVYILDEKEENQFIPDVSILCDKTKIGNNFTNLFILFLSSIKNCPCFIWIKTV